MSTIVTLDLNNFNTDDLISELEDRDYKVLENGETDANEEALENTLDKIYDLYRDFIRWDKNRMTNMLFEEKLKKFFEITIDEKLV